MSGTMTNISTEHVTEIELNEKNSMRKIMEENVSHIETPVKKDQYNTAETIKEKSNIEDTEHNNSIHNSNSITESDSSEIEEEGSDEEREIDFTNDKINNEDKETNAKESYVEMNDKRTKGKEVHMLNEDSSMSKDDDVNSSQDSLKPKKKKTKIQLKAKIHSYFHKSYDKVSNVIMRTSKSFIKSGHTSDYRNDKTKGMHNSGSMLFTSKSDELLVDNNESILLEDELNMLKEYLDAKLNVEKSNIEILTQFKSDLENNIPEKLLNTLTDLLIERKLLIKSVKHFKHENETIKSCLEKYKNSYFILKTENEQLNENAKTLKSYIDNIQKYNENDINDVADKMTTTNDISMEPKKEAKELS